MDHKRTIIGALLVLALLTMGGQPETRVISVATLPLLPSPPVLVATTSLVLEPQTPAVGTPVIPPTSIPQTPDIYHSYRYGDPGSIAMFQTQIADPSISEGLRNTLRTDVAQEYHSMEERATQLAQAPQTPIFQTATPTPIGYQEPTLIVPTFIGVGPMMDSALFDIATIACTSMWQGMLPQYIVQIRTCYQKADPMQAFLIVSPFSRDPNHPIGPDSFPTPDPADPPWTGNTPQRVGPVTITRVDDTLLTLQAADGTTFLFDAATLRYVTNPSVTALPIPTSTADQSVTTIPTAEATTVPPIP